MRLRRILNDDGRLCMFELQYTFPGSDTSHTVTTKLFVFESDTRQELAAMLRRARQGMRRVAELASGT